MDRFAEIRPYNDDEVTAVIERIVTDDETLSAVLKLKLSNYPAWVLRMLKPVARYFLRKQMRGVDSVGSFQEKLAHYLEHMVEETMTGFSVSGLDALDKKQAYLFISNHRDITLDPAFVNYALYINKQDTVRIAIGDNLLTKAFATDLMRINKSFIVKRGEKAPRKLLASLKLLSEYISHSLQQDQHSVWIAQREGRAKNGVDRTDSAILKMLAIHAGRKVDFAEVIKAFRIVPVSISYEYDPCDVLKATELYAVQQSGAYVKGDQEDIASIATGISGFKGQVHLNFGAPIEGSFASAEDLAAYLDKAIVEGYVLHASNFFAYHAIFGNYPDVLYSDKQIAFNPDKLKKEQAFFEQRIAAVEPQLRDAVLYAYANPLVSKLALK